MSTVIDLPISLPAVPKGYKAPSSFSPLSEASTSTKLFPAGPAYHAHSRRVLNQRSFVEDDEHLLAESAKNGAGIVQEDDVDQGLGDEQESKDLLQLDPKLWKSQDHYAVLGLQDLRYKATDEQIKKAHRRKVLRHHPDKKASAGGEANDDSFFKCIAKAMEVLSNPEKRRQFDSVDEGIDDDDVPDAKDTNQDNFYALWGKVFEREGRFSKQQPVPSLGDADTDRKTVEAFYDFFYSIDSWRSFEYLDKDSPEGTESRDEKRHQEKKNKSERAKKKKEDIARVRELVDRALSLDPRIKQFKAAEKAARDAKKQGGAAGGAAVDPKVKAAEDAKKAEEEKKAKEEEAQKAADDKVSREAAKKQKEKAKKDLKKHQKVISSLVTTNNYFTTSPTPAVVEACLTELDLIFTKLEPEEIGNLRNEAETKNSGEAIKKVLISYAQKVDGGEFKQFA